jgi:hypothetical protein
MAIRQTALIARLQFAAFAVSDASGALSAYGTLVAADAIGIWGAC